MAALLIFLLAALVGYDLGLSLMNLVKKRSTEPSLVFYAVLLGALFFAALGLIKLLAKWEQGRVEPFRTLERGMAAQEVQGRVGDADYSLFSDGEVRKAAEDWNLLCREFDQILPEGTGVRDRSHRYFDSVEVKLTTFPTVVERVDLYRPAFLHAIMVYLDNKGLVTRILVCAP